MKQILLGILCLALGAAAALGIKLYQSRARSRTEIVLSSKKNNFEPTEFSMEEAPSESIRGQITNINGEIWWQSRTATEPARLPETIPVQQGEIWIASDSGNLTIEFAPAATVSLFPETTVEIVQTLPLNLVFNQSQGVSQYQKTGDSPVTVRSLNLIVDLADGLLVVDTDEKMGQIILGLKTGTAKIGYNSQAFASKVWQLSPGDVFEYNSNLRRGYFK